MSQRGNTIHIVTETKHNSYCHRDETQLIFSQRQATTNRIRKGRVSPLFSQRRAKNYDKGSRAVQAWYARTKGACDGWGSCNNQSVAKLQKFVKVGYDRYDICLLFALTLLGRIELHIIWLEYQKKVHMLSALSCATTLIKSPSDRTQEDNLVH